MLFQKKNKKIDKEFVETQALATSEEDVNKAIDNGESIEAKIINSGLLEKYAELGKLMLSMLKDYRRGLYKQVPWFTVASIAFALLYVLNPFDLIPDFIPGLGYIDDLGVLTIALRFAETDLHDYLDWKIAHEEEA